MKQVTSKSQVFCNNLETPDNMIIFEYIRAFNQARTEPLDFSFKIQKIMEYMVEDIVIENLETIVSIPEDDNLIHQNITNINSRDLLTTIPKETPTHKNSNQTKKFKIEIDGICSINLVVGPKKFEDAINILQSSFSNLKPLEFREDLCIQVPNSREEWTRREIITKLLNELQYKKKHVYKTLGFHFTIGIKNCLISSILQIVDDSPFRGSRRDNILSNSFKYVGISYRSIEGVNCHYFTFAS